MGETSDKVCHDTKSVIYLHVSDRGIQAFKGIWINGLYWVLIVFQLHNPIEALVAAFVERDEMSDETPRMPQNVDNSKPDQT